MRELDFHPHYAWFPVMLSDTGEWAWLQYVWCRKEFLGPRMAKLGDYDLMIWCYYRRRIFSTPSSQ